MKNNKRNRRQFLKQSAALAGMAIGGVSALRAQTQEPEAIASSKGPDLASPEVLARRLYGQRSRFEKAERWSKSGPQAFTPLADVVGVITPAQYHYVVSHGYNPPDIDPQQHRLMIHGLVERPLIFTLAE